MIRLLTLGQTGIQTPGAVLDSTAPKLVVAGLYIAMARGRRVSRDELARLFWPDAPSPRAHHNTRELLHRLKKLGLPLDTDAASVALDPALVSADYESFRAADLAGVTDAMIAATSAVLPLPDLALSTFTPALNRWVEDLRSSIARELTRGLVAAISAARTAGDWRRVEQLATACRAVDPLNEEANLALAESLCMTASKERALALLDDYSAQLGNAAALRLPVRLLRERIVAASGSWTGASGDRATEPPFVGRGAARNALLGAFDSACRQQGRACCVWGPAGIGKTRLLAEVAKDVTLRGGTALSLTCHAADNLRPLSVLFDLVPRLLELPGALGGDAAALSELRALASKPVPDTIGAKDTAPDDSLRLRRQAALLDVLDAVADERPLVIIVDDAQWMDPALSTFWSLILPWSRTRSILWLFGCRADVEEAVLATSFGVHAQPMHLGALDVTASRELVSCFLEHDADGDVASRVADRGGGHPLVLRELARHYVATRRLDERPASIAPLIDERLNHLSRPALRLLQAGGLLDALATMERVGRLVDLPMSGFNDAIAELATLGIVDQESGTRLRCHALWTEAAVSRLQPIVAATLHRNAAQLLEDEMGSAPSLQLLWECARHWQSGGDSERALVAYERGAEHLVNHGFLRDAADVYARAVEQCVDVARRLSLLRRRIRILQATGQLRVEIAAIDEHERLASDTDLAYDVHNDLELRRVMASGYVSFESERAAHATLACAMNESAAASHRLLAAWHIARLSETLGLPSLLSQAFEISERLPVTTNDCLSRKRLTAIKYHVMVGDPSRAVALMRVCVDDERKRSLDDLLRTLDNAFDTYLVCGAIVDARSAAQELLALALQHHRLWMMRLAYERLICLAFEFDTTETARHWIKRLTNMYERYDFGDQTFAEVYLPTHWAQLHITEDDGEAARKAAPARELCFGENVARWRVRLLGVHLGAALLCNDDLAAHELAPFVECDLHERRRWVDFPAAMYARYLERFEGEDSARAFVAKFVRDVRRELYPPSPELQRYLGAAVPTPT